MISQSKKPVASTRQDKIQLSEVASAKTSARVSVTLLAHVLLGLLIALFVISIFMSVLVFSELLSKSLMCLLGDRPALLPQFVRVGAAQKRIRINTHVWLQIKAKTSCFGDTSPLHPNINRRGRIIKRTLPGRSARSVRRKDITSIVRLKGWHRSSVIVAERC